MKKIICFSLFSIVFVPSIKCSAQDLHEGNIQIIELVKRDSTHKFANLFWYIYADSNLYPEYIFIDSRETLCSWHYISDTNYVKNLQAFEKLRKSFNRKFRKDLSLRDFNYGSVTTNIMYTCRSVEMKYYLVSCAGSSQLNLLSKSIGEFDGIIPTDINLKSLKECDLPPSVIKYIEGAL